MGTVQKLLPLFLVVIFYLIAESNSAFQGTVTVTVYPNGLTRNCTSYVGFSPFTSYFRNSSQYVNSTTSQPTPLNSNICYNNSIIINPSSGSPLLSVNGFTFSGSRRSYPNYLFQAVSGLDNFTYDQLLDGLKKRDLSDEALGQGNEEYNQPGSNFILGLFGTKKVEEIRFTKLTDRTTPVMFDAFRKLSYSVYRPNCTIPITPPVVFLEFSFPNPRAGLDGFRSSISMAVEGVISGFTTRHGGPSSLSSTARYYDDVAVTVNFVSYSFSSGNRVGINNQQQVTGSVSNYRAFNYMFGIYSNRGPYGVACIDYIPCEN